MKHARLLIVLSFAAFSLAGCAGSTPTFTPSLEAGSGLDVTTLQGAWTLVSMQPAGEAQQATPLGASYTLTLDDNRLSARVDCNSCSGSFAVNERTLVAGPLLACTRAACATMAFENTFGKLLSGENTVAVSDATLVLTSPRGTLRFVR